MISEWCVVRPKGESRRFSYCVSKTDWVLEWEEIVEVASSKEDARERIWKLELKESRLAVAEDLRKDAETREALVVGKDSLTASVARAMSQELRCTVTDRGIYAEITFDDPLLDRIA